jgi:hypothetical protein
MPDSLIGSSNVLDAAINASRQARRQNLARRLRNQKIRTRIVLGQTGCIGLFAIAASLIGDYAAARFCAMMSCIVLAFSLVAGAAARKKTADALRETDRP